MKALKTIKAMILFVSLSISSFAMGNSFSEFELHENYTCQFGWADYCLAPFQRALENLDQKADEICHTFGHMSERLSATREPKTMVVFGDPRLVVGLARATYICETN